MKQPAIALKTGCTIYAGKDMVLTVTQKRLPLFTEGIIYIVVEELKYPLVMLEKDEVEVVGT
ncbi:hypothetical protein J4573_16335 [Actinomadura barringtoniae]|uniref:Uncharacterized protein n=1 Tax=Actinomadura barringtoniae TaxID=1427535 RepID=A0A939T209_9ACTN|nr:hypothetical protein [Actinomadura barringtoniae]MBO2448671.1 hypothetical protein [Actinomadura barringtoniae]